MRASGTSKPSLLQGLTALTETFTIASAGSQSRSDRIAVIYLARQAEGIAPLQKFVDSYVRNPAGIEHQLVVVYKGFDRVNELNAAKSVFVSLPHFGFEISDEGFDVNAYLEAARSLDQDYVCCINTFTEIACAGWLLMLYQYAASPRVGIAGAMGSYESLYDSYALIRKVIWLCNEISVSYDEQFAYFYAFIIDNYCKVWKARAEGQANAITKALAPWIIATISRLKRSASLTELMGLSRQQGSLEEQFLCIWTDLTSPGGRLADYSRFPPFPDPHIRSNGFMVSRQRFLELNTGIKTKLDACAFESGTDSMTSRIRRKGLEAVVVDRSGHGYDVADWVRSKTFRLGNQEDLILTDNQSRSFDAMAPGSRATHVRMTWGDYLGPPPPKFPDLSFKFAVKPLDLVLRGRK